MDNLVAWAILTPMGDKSPKAKDRNRKQDTASKDQKRAAALAKATPVVAAGKKGR
jgi:hypothetical protein